MASSPSFSLGLLLQKTSIGARYAGADTPEHFDIDRLAGYVTALEAAGYGMVVIGEGLDRSSATLESFTQAAYFAFRAQRILLAVAANTNYVEPFSIARLIASQDHVTHGRTAWLVTSDETKESAANHQTATTNYASRAARRAEAIDVVDGLCLTWQADAFTRDQSTGAFIDTDKVALLNHRGEHFAVRGPLNVARPPQGHIPKVTYVDTAALPGPEADSGTLSNAARLNLNQYRILLTLGLNDDQASRLRSAAKQDVRLLKVVVPLINSEPQTARGSADRAEHIDHAERLQRYLHAIPLDADWQYNPTPGRKFEEIGDFYGTDGLSPPGSRNAAALSVVTGHDFIGAPADLPINDTIRDVLSVRGRALLDIARQRADRIAEYMESATPVRLIDLLRAFVEPREIFVGTLTQWHDAVAHWSRSGSPFDGLLIAPATEDVLNADFAKALAMGNVR